MKLSIRGRHKNKKYRRTYRRNNNRNKRTQYVSQGGSGSEEFLSNNNCEIFYNFNLKLSYSKNFLPIATSNFNITLSKQLSPDEKPNELKFILLMQRLSKNKEEVKVDKTFTVYFTVIFFKNNYTNDPCNSCYEICYSQDPDGNDKNKQILDITYQLNYVEKSSVDKIFTVKNDIFDPKLADTYKFNCDDPINKIFFVKLLNILNKCIIDKYKTSKPN